MLSPAPRETTSSADDATDAPHDTTSTRDAPFLLDHWHILLDAARLGTRPMTVTRFGQQLVLWRDADGRPVAQDARCPHRGADLGLGRVVDGALECPYHGFRFAPEGHCVRVPCAGKHARIRKDLVTRRHEVREARGFLWIFWGAPRDTYPPLPWFDAMPEDTRRSATITLTWDVPFARVVEGNLDLHHFPFAHRHFAHGMGHLLDPYDVRVDGPVVHTRGVLRKDDGTPHDGKKGMAFQLSMHFPGILFADFGMRVRGIGGITPIDEGNTLVVFRYHVDVPILGGLLAWLSLLVDGHLVQRDDHRMLRASTPARHDLRQYKLVHADAGIAAWHKLYRRALRAQAAASLTAGKRALPLIQA
ncbi:Rieske 2Fe-2S domain-containing protein [Chondromyces crocatus]|uniref:(2Fe-2S)-binding protein n=1 Tax=Chondromyces crocatus TaxID=52 RepID=A0A0K1EJD4_CHOCO|nr:Rieske 2Fe-2S domain-containing protein [Chondromyces crocatus]AKT40981.1 (2Fe-2S)-binding protein [Chondromyces crocatus]